VVSIASRTACCGPTTVGLSPRTCRGGPQESMAEALVEEECLTWELLKELSVDQMKMVKIPMGKALMMKRDRFKTSVDAHP
jgi:hypothetical protein